MLQSIDTPRLEEPAAVEPDRATLTTPTGPGTTVALDDELGDEPISEPMGIGVTAPASLPQQI